MSTVTLAIIWTLNGQPMPPIVAPVDLPFGKSTTYEDSRCRAAERQWLRMAMDELERGTALSMTHRFVGCVERRGS